VSGENKKGPDSPIEALTYLLGSGKNMEITWGESFRLEGRRTIRGNYTIKRRGKRVGVVLQNGLEQQD